MATSRSRTPGRQAALCQTGSTARRRSRAGVAHTSTHSPGHYRWRTSHSHWDGSAAGARAALPALPCVGCHTTHASLTDGHSRWLNGEGRLSRRRSGRVADPGQHLRPVEPVGEVQALALRVHADRDDRGMSWVPLQNNRPARVAAATAALALGRVLSDVRDDRAGVLHQVSLRHQPLADDTGRGSWSDRPYPPVVKRAFFFDPAAARVGVDRNWLRQEAELG
jgi:hypothetical protein